MEDKKRNRRSSGETKTPATAGRQKFSILVPPKFVQAWLAEKAVLEREIALKTRRLAWINRRLCTAGLLVEDKPLAAKPLAPESKLTLIDAVDKIANESPAPVTKAELRRRLCAMGLPAQNFNNYFYVAIRRLKRRKRISVLEDGSVWGRGLVR